MKIDIVLVKCNYPLIFKGCFVFCENINCEDGYIYDASEIE